MPLEPHRQRLEVAPGQAAVGGEALGQDQQVAYRVHPVVVRSTMKPPMLTMPSFLALMVAPSAYENIFARCRGSACSRSRARAS